MADKTYYATRSMRHPRYRTRMLEAGDVVEDVGPLAKLFEQRKLITTEKPKRAKAEAEPAPAEAPKPAAKRAPRKKAAAKKK